MKGDPVASVKWLGKPENHDFPAAADYLALLADVHTVNELTEQLRAGAVVHKKAKDILRAARLRLLDEDNPHVAADLAKIKKGQPLSPILLIRGNYAAGVPCRSRTATTGCAPVTTPTRTPISRSFWCSGDCDRGRIPRGTDRGRAGAGAIRRAGVGHHRRGPSPLRNYSSTATPPLVRRRRCEVLPVGRRLRSRGDAGDSTVSSDVGTGASTVSAAASSEDSAGSSSGSGASTFSRPTSAGTSSVPASSVSSGSPASSVSAASSVSSSSSWPSSSSSSSATASSVLPRFFREYGVP